MPYRRRFVALCLVLLSANCGVYGDGNGKIRGSNTGVESPVLDAAANDGNQHRLLNRRNRHHKTTPEKHEVQEYATEHPGTEYPMPEQAMMAHLGTAYPKPEQVTMDHVTEHPVPIYEYVATDEEGNKHGKRKGGMRKGGMKGSRRSSGSQKSKSYNEYLEEEGIAGKQKGVQKGGGDYAKGGGDYAKGGGDYAKGGGDYAKGGGEYAKGGGDFAKKGGEYAKGGGEYADGGGEYAQGGGEYHDDYAVYGKGKGKGKKSKYASGYSRSKKSGKYGHGPGGPPILKKSKSSGKEYAKSKYKLVKLSDEYHYTDEPTYHPTQPAGPSEPTLVEVPMTFKFAFEESADGAHVPTPEEVATLHATIAEYANALFEYLHESNPETFISVTPIIDKVVIKSGAPFPLEVEVTFHLLYNESPEDAPSPHEVASILESAFTSEEFTYYYLWTGDDIWNTVTMATIESNLPEESIPGTPGTPGTPETPGSPDVRVGGTMIYDFSSDPIDVPPTDDDYDLLVNLTQSFYNDVLVDLYRNDPDTHFQEIAVAREGTTFDLNATPPVVVDYFFLARFDEGSPIIPTSEDLFDILAVGDPINMFKTYIRLYLEPSVSIWSTVNRVSFLELTSGGEEGVPGGGGGPISQPPSAVVAIASMLYSFFEGAASRPGKSDYDRLLMATNLFFIDTLTEAYQDRPKVGFVMTTTTMEAGYYTDGLPEPLQVDYNTQVYFQGSTAPPTSEEVFAVLQSANYEAYIREYLWPEGTPWNNINGVMYMERIPPQEIAS